MCCMSEHGELVGGNRSAEPLSVYGRGLPPQRGGQGCAFHASNGVPSIQSFDKNGNCSLPCAFVTRWLALRFPGQGAPYIWAARILGSKRKRSRAVNVRRVPVLYFLWTWTISSK